jgi:hypothetical protein
MYLVDAAVEIAWIMAWYQADVPAPTATGNT